MLSPVQLFATPWTVACQAPLSKDPGSIPVSGRSPGEGKDNPLQYPCLENPMDNRKVRHDWATNSFKTWFKLLDWLFVSWFEILLQFSIPPNNLKWNCFVYFIVNIKCLYLFEQIVQNLRNCSQILPPPGRFRPQ